MTAGPTSRFGWDTTAEEVARSADLRGRLAVLTGASSGIGVETARGLAIAGANVVLGVRDVEAGEAVARDIAPEATGEIRVLRLELRELASVADFADAITGPVDLLIANAGVSKTPDAHLPNGLDVRFATNHLGHFMLALRLRRQMAERGARIVVVSSAAHKGAPVCLDDLQWQTRAHQAGLAYAESKSANILFAQEATRRWGPNGIFANAVLPGFGAHGLAAVPRGSVEAPDRFHPARRHPESRPQDGRAGRGDDDVGGNRARVGRARRARARGLRRGAARRARHASMVGLRRTRADPETARRLWNDSIDLLRTLGADV